MHTLQKLLFAKLCTCYCVCLWFDQPSLKIPWVLCKSYLMLENLRELIKNLKFLEKWVKNLCFWKTFHLILMHFILKIQCFEGFLHKTSLFFFSKICFFQNFDWLNLFFNQTKLRLKTLVILCLFRSMLDWYLFNRSIFVRSNLIFYQSKIV